jgi:prepilin-type processing-associated H-X9-DG protein
LIEVLVVVAIIALLISILLPSLSRARAQARGTVCLANLHRLGHAMVFYVDQYKVFPPFRLQSVYNPATGSRDPYVNKYGRGQPRWQWFLDYGVGTPIDSAGVAAGSDEMTSEFFLCPELRGEHATNIRNGAYGYNYQYLGNSRDAGTGYQRWPVRESMIKSPVRTVSVGDSRGAALPHGPHSYSLDPPRLGTEAGATRFGPSWSSDTPNPDFAFSPVEMRHNGRGNVQFADGHAEPMRLPQLGYGINSEGVAIPNHPGAANHLWNGLGGDPTPIPQ